MGKNGFMPLSQLGGSPSREQTFCVIRKRRLNARPLVQDITDNYSPRRFVAFIWRDSPTRFNAFESASR